MSMAGRRWQTQERRGLSHREAGQPGGKRSGYAPPRSPETRQEVALRWLLGESTQAALAREHGVALSTIRRWCSTFDEKETNDGSSA
jgi:transposase-like protein